MLKHSVGHRVGARRAGQLASVATVALVAGGCVAGGGDEQDVHVASSGGLSSVADSTPSPTAGKDDTLTGTPAPRKGESGFRQLPECFGIRATILGSPGDDRISGTRREDVILTFGGADVVTDLGRDDAVCTGAGDDVVRSTSEGRRSTVWAVDLGAGNDDLRVTEAFDIFGGPGADRIVVVQGPAEVSGGPGADHLRAISTKRPYGIAENAPCLYFADSPRPVRVNLDEEWARGAGHDRVVNFRCLHGSRYADLLVGSASGDAIHGRAGFDVVRAGGGNDTAIGGLHADRIYLGAGDDFGQGEDGWDRIYGEDGNDNLEGWSDGDYLDGGAGNDDIYAAIFCAIGGYSYDTAGLWDAAPNELFGGSGDDYLVGDKGNDRIDGGTGYDVGHGGYRDGRIDWIESLESPIDGCLAGTEAYTVSR